MTVAPVLWPADGQGKAVLCLKLNCKADELFKEMCVNPDLSAQMHKLRNDNNLFETGWYRNQDELPEPRFTWDPSAAKPTKVAAAAGTWRKSKFDSPPAAMVKLPFQNEELHHLLECKSGVRYVMEIQANTNAYMGDKFDVVLKMTISAAQDKASCFLHVQYCIVWSKAANFMVKSTLGVPVDGGVRHSYKMLRQALDSKYKCEELTEAQLTAQLAETPAESAVPHEPAVPGVAATAAAAALPAAHHMAPGKPAGLSRPLDFFMSQLVWDEQVAAVSGVVGVGMRSAASEGIVARVMAAVVTLSLIHAVVSILHAVQAVCTGRRYVLWALCLPVTHMVDLPDSLTEVLTSVLLVAAINYGILWSAQASLAHFKPAQQQGADVSLVSPDAAQQPASTDIPAADSKAELDSSKAAAASSTAADSTAKSKPIMSAPPARPIPQLQHISKAGPKRPDIVAPKGRAAPVAASAASASAASAPVLAAAAPTPAATTTAHGFVHSHSTTVLNAANGSMTVTAPLTSASMPRASSSQPLTSTSSKPSEVEIPTITPVKTNGSVTKPPADTTTAPATAAAVTPVSPEAAKSPMHDTAAAAPSRPTTPAASTAAAAATAGVITAAVTAAASDKGSRQGSPAPQSIPSSSTGKAHDRASVSSIPAQDTAPAGAIDTPSAPDGPGSLSVNTSNVVSGPGSLAAVLVPPASPPPPSRSPSTPRGTATTPPAAVSPVAGPAITTTPVTSPTAGSTAAAAAAAQGPGGVPGGHIYGAQYPPAGSPSNLPPDLTKTWYKTMSEGMDALAEGFKGAFGMKAGEEGGVVGLPGADGTAGGAGRAGLTTWESGPAAVGGAGEVPGPAGGHHPSVQEGPLQAEEEVFENERFQPFRGWGHTWPGHFLPSDRVGHWSDAQGGPGGSASMIFEQVEPVLPPGYTWVEDEWQLDMEAVDREGVDEHGWTYALDFNYLRHPPPAGSGKCTLKHFVRRRRWFRTRIRLSSTAPPPQHMSKDDGSLARTTSLSASTPAAPLLTPPAPARTSPTADRQLSSPRVGLGSDELGKAGAGRSGGGGIAAAAAGTAGSVVDDGQKQQGKSSKVLGGGGGGGGIAAQEGVHGVEDGAGSRAAGGQAVGSQAKTSVGQVKAGGKDEGSGARSVEMQSPRAKDEQEMTALPKRTLTASLTARTVSDAGKRALGAVKISLGNSSGGTEAAAAPSLPVSQSIAVPGAGAGQEQLKEVRSLPAAEASGAVDAHRHTRSARQAALGKALEAMLKHDSPPTAGLGASLGADLAADGLSASGLNRSPRAVDAAAKPPLGPSGGSGSSRDTSQHPLR